MAFPFYSQGIEEEIILDYFGSSEGRFLDCGAYDGKTFSNVRRLAENGWKGVCIEPAAHPFDCMAQDPPPNTELVNCLIGERTELVPFHLCQDALSSTSEKHAHKWRKVADFTPVWVMSLSVSDLLDRFPGPYRFLNVDCESTSQEVLRLFEPHFDDLEVELFCVEHDGAHFELQGFKEIFRNDGNSIQCRR